MIRPLTCLSVLLAGASGLYLYQTKHEAQLLDRDIAHTLKAADTARERIGMLRAEWALLNEPEQLQKLATRFLPLHQMLPAQFVQMSELATRLPAPQAPGSVPPAPDATEEEEAPAPVVHLQDVPEHLQAIPRHVPEQSHAALPARPQPQHYAARSAEPHDHPPQVAAREASPLAPVRPVPLAAPRPMGAAVLNALAAPMRAAPSRHAGAAHAVIGAAPPYARPSEPSYARTIEARAYTRAAAEPAHVASALGMARSASLAPPVPLAAPLPVR